MEEVLSTLISGSKYTFLIMGEYSFLVLMYAVIYTEIGYCQELHTLKMKNISANPLQAILFVKFPVHGILNQESLGFQITVNEVKGQFPGIVGTFADEREGVLRFPECA